MNFVIKKINMRLVVKNTQYKKDEVIKNTKNEIKETQMVLEMSIGEIFLEIDRERFKLAMLSSIVNVVLVFLILNYIFTLFRFNFLLNIVISGIVFYASMHLYMKKFDVPSLKKRDPKTEEMLKTARDNVKEDNVVVSEFFKQIAEKVKDVSFSDLFSMRSFTIRLVLIIVIALFSVLMPASEAALHLGFLGNLFQNNGIGEGISLDSNEDIFKAPEIIDAENQEIQINIKASNNELDFSKIKEIEQREFARNPFPTAAEAVSDTPSNEKAHEDFALIKEYNLAIRESG